MALPAFSYVISMAIYVLFLFLFLEYSREKRGFYKWFFVVGLLTFPLWFSNLHSWFRWAKSISVLFPLVLVGWWRVANDPNGEGFMPSLKKKWPLWALYALLMVNIAEATLTDFELGNYFNAFSGLVLCITIPLPTKHWRIGKSDGKNTFAELIADLPLTWCLLYVTWNAAFVYAENTAFFASSVCILLAPEIWILAKKRVDLWLHARVYTLGIHILIRSSYDVFAPVMDSSAWFNADVLYFWGLANAILHGGYLVFWFFKLRSKDYVVPHSEMSYGY